MIIKESPSTPTGPSAPRPPITSISVRRPEGCPVVAARRGTRRKGRRMDTDADANEGAGHKEWRTSLGKDSSVPPFWVRLCAASGPKLTRCYLDNTATGARWEFSMKSLVWWVKYKLLQQDMLILIVMRGISEVKRHACLVMCSEKPSLLSGYF